MEDPLLLVDLFFADVALGDEVVIFSLVLEIGEVDLVHNPRVVLLEQLHIAHQVLLVILQHSLHSFFTLLVLINYQIVSLGFPVREEGLKLFVHEVCLVDG